MSGYDQFFKAARSAQKDKTKNNNKIRNKTGPSRQVQPTGPTEVEKLLRETLKVRTVKSKKKPLPHITISFLFLGFLLAGWGFYAIDNVEQWFDKVEVGWLGQASAQEKKTETKGAGKENAADKEKMKTQSTTAENSPSVKEEMSYFAKLRDRKKELDVREAELNELEEELHKQKSEIEARIVQLESMRRDIAGVLKERVEVDQEKVGKLVEFYSNMKPAQAAEILAKINEDLAVEVLGRMKKKNAADVLNLLEPQKARVLSEKFTGYKRR